MQINNLDKLKAYIKFVIKQKGYGKYKTAEKIGVEYKTLHEFLNSDRNITLVNLESICDFCGIEICFKAKSGICKNDEENI